MNKYYALKDNLYLFRKRHYPLHGNSMYVRLSTAIAKSRKKLTFVALFFSLTVTNNIS